METKVSKAQEVRDRQNLEMINSDLRRRLLDFENKYLNNAVQYAFKVVQNKVKYAQKLVNEFHPATSLTTLQNLQWRLQRAERELELDATITLEAIVEAKKSYDLKVDKLARTLVQEGFGHAHYVVERIKDAHGTELAFLISKSDKEVHARLIFVNGDIKAPHFRFITTTRAIK